MDAAIKAKWLEALRSGEYEHSKQRCGLRDSDGFDALGVLCDVMDCEWKWSDEHLCYGVTDRRVIGLQKTGLPPTVRDATGLDDSASFGRDVEARGPLGGKHVGWSVMSINDSGASFEGIADVVEANL